MGLVGKYDGQLGLVFFCWEISLAYHGKSDVLLISDVFESWGTNRDLTHQIVIHWEYNGNVMENQFSMA